MRKNGDSKHFRIIGPMRAFALLARTSLPLLMPHSIKSLLSHSPTITAKSKCFVLHAIERQTLPFPASRQCSLTSPGANACSSPLLPRWLSRSQLPLRLAHVQYSRLPLLDNKLLEQFLSTAIIEGRLAFLHGWLACSLDESRQNNFVGQLTWMSSRS